MQMRSCFQISSLPLRALKNQSAILNAIVVDQATQALSILEAKIWK